MKLSRLFAALAALTSVGATDHHETSGEQLRVSHSVVDSDRMSCTVFESHSLTPISGGQSTERLVCDADDNGVYTLTDVPNDFFDGHSLASGSIRMSVLNSCVYNSNYMDMSACAAQMLDSKVGNVSANTKGIRSLIVMRVIDSRSVEPTLSKADFSDGIFGTGLDVYNLSTGYALCSGNELQFAPGKFIDATDGVMDLILPVSTLGKSQYEVEALARTAMGNYAGFDSNLYDHIMWVLEPKINFLAYAYINWKYSVFQDLWAARPSALIHELGHNLGYLHSGTGTNVYGDQSGMMGFSYKNDEGPVMCFNAAKSWHLNWYSNVDLNPLTTTGVELNLIGIDDYVNGVSTKAHTTVVKIFGGIEDLYFMYNRRKGINSGTVKFGNTVNIVAQIGKGGQSWTRAQLSGGQTYTVNEFAGGNTGNLVIKVCEISLGIPGTPDVARTLVYVENADQPSCTQLTPSPTNEPIMPPTVAPTNSPTPQPITPPTNEPTNSPTNEPSYLPTVAPTDSPSPQPTTPPTNEPTNSPTNEPSYLPTVAPTDSPSPQPTTPPTTPPTDAPTNSPTRQPSTPPTNAPTTSPTNKNCVDSSKSFLRKFKKGPPEEVIGETCGWLLEKSQKSIKRICKKNACKNDLLEPRRVCPVACEFCDTYAQNMKSRFYKETKKDGTEIKKSCEWLQDQKTKKQIKYCSITKSPFCYGTAKEICPKVCKEVTG